MPDETIKIKILKEKEINDNFGEISWQIEKRLLNHKNTEGLWAMAIVGLAIVVFSVLLKNYLLIIIIALAVFIVYASKNKTPELHHFGLDRKGLYINGKFYPYENFESFWIFEDKEIAFRSKHRLMPLLIIPFHVEEEDDIRKIISNYLPESEEEESFLDLLQKKFF